MNVVLKIHGREALAVWTLPYITSWRLSPDMLLERLASDAMYAGEKFPVAFTLASDKTPTSLLPAQWHELNNLIAKLEQDLTDNNLSRVKDRKVWKKETVEEFWEDEPAYVWLDEFSQWYEGFINNYWVREKNENTDLCFNPKLPNSHAEYFEKYEKRRVKQVDVDFKAIPLDAVDMEEQENQVNKKGWPTMTLENFVERVLVRHVGEQYAIPTFLKLLEEYELVVRDGVMDAEPIDTANLIKRINQKSNDVMFDLWEALLIKERHYSIHRSDVAEAYKRADKFEFPWLQIDEKYSCLPCIDFVETNSNGNDASKLPGLPATESDFKEALNQDSWTAREAIFWLQGRNPEWCRGDIENYFKYEVDLVRRAIKQKEAPITNDETSPVEWIRWATSKDWKLPDYISEFILNDEAIDWKYWATIPSIKSCEAARLSLSIDPIKYPDSECSLGQLTDGIKTELRKRERWLESHSDTWTLPQLVEILGDNRTPDGMKNAAVEWKSNKQVTESQTVKTKNQANESLSKPWLVKDSKDPEPKYEWYTAARYFARQLVKDDSTLLTKKNILTNKVVTSLTQVGIKKRGGEKEFDPNTIKKALSNIKLR